MKIGVPREVMDNEFRVGVVPAGVQALVQTGHTVLVEKNAGAGSGIADRDFEAAGALVMPTAREVFAAAELIVKVKEPLEQEFASFRSGQTLFTFLHLAPRKTLTDFLCQSNIRAIAYETVQLDDGSLPILAPMSEVAGRLSIQVGAHYLEKSQEGSGVLLGGVPGVEHGKITVVGGGTVGSNAVRIAQAMGAEVTVLDVNMSRLEYLDELYSGRVKTLMSNEHNIGAEVRESDLVIGAVLITGRKSPLLVSREMVGAMRPGSVVIDVAIDQGGCIETARPTTHSQPTFEVDGVIHYCVANMPGAVPRTSTFALTNVTLPYVLDMAGKGVGKALQDNSVLRSGLNIFDGRIASREVAESQGRKWQDPFQS